MVDHVDSFAGTTRDVGFWFDYVSPNSNSHNTLSQINGTSLTDATPGADVTLTFGTEAKSSFGLSYADAGSLNLHARFAGSGDEVGLVMEGSTTQAFVVAPDHFEVTSVLNNGATNGMPVAVAGNPFSASIQAVCADGTHTPNFVAPITLAAIAPYMPASGMLGTLANGSIAASAFSFGAASPSNLNYSEVGNFTMQAQGLNYLGRGLNVIGTSAPVGRFIPDHFMITNNSPLFTDSCGGFTYLDQPFHYAPVGAPQITITALGATGSTTLNYGGNFWKFSSRLANRQYSNQSGSSAILTTTIDTGNAALAGDNNYDGIGVLSLDDGSNGDIFTYQRQVEESLFDADINMEIPVTDLTDTDGVCYDITSDGSCDSFTLSNISGTELRFGRVRLENTHGSELLPLAMPIYAEYFDGNSFIINSSDNCTVPTLTSFTFVKNPSANGDPGLIPLVNGVGQLAWNNVPYSPGSIDVSFNLGINYPWLRYDWDSDSAFDDDPEARATFGIYKGNEHIIYLRETTWR